MLIKLLIAAVVLLSLMFIGLTWLVALLAKVSLLLPAAVTALFVVAVLGVFVLRRLRAAGAARGLERGLREQAKAQAKHVRPDLEPELHQMQEAFDRAVSALKSAPGGRRHGTDALYYLPWYAIIGPSGAGKTTALRHSGLRFPPMKGARDVKVRGLGGTRNCDWWLTNQAVLLDTAGRWSTQEEDHDEWLGFLGLLKKYRPRKPLNGVIAAISVGDIVNASEDDVDALARRMRERVDEVIGQLHVSLPVYVLFTKCDLVEGFVETFSELPAADREQVWGFTAAVSGDNAEPGVLFEERFDELTQTLERVSLARIGVERRTEMRQLIYAFPQQVMTMRHNLSRFIATMFETNVYQETPGMRGVYFTSGTQEGRPFSLLLNRLAEAMGVQDRLPAAAAPVVDQKSYFLKDVFMKVIFEDQQLASVSQAELRRQRLRRLALTGVLSAVALCVGVIPSLGFGASRLQLVQTDDLIDFWEHPPSSPRLAAARIAGVERLLADLTRYEAEAPSFIATLGMYQGDRVLPHLRHYSAALIRRELVQPLVARDVQALTEFGFKYQGLPQAVPTSQEHARFYDMLKLHVLLTVPKSSDEPQLDEPRRAWLSPQLAKRWAAMFGLEDAKDRARVDAIAQRYIASATQYAELAFPRDKEVVARTRAALTRLPLARHALERIIARVAEEGYDLTLPKLIGQVGAVSARQAVRGAFTQRGWENVVRDQLNADAVEHAGELWVLGLADRRDNSRQIEAQIAELTSLYFQSYAEEWRSFLQGIRVKRPASNAESLALLGELLRGQSPPFALLMQKVHHNVHLRRKQTASALAESTFDTLKDKAVNLLRSKDEEKAAAKSKKKQAQVAANLDDESYTPGKLAAAFEGFTSFAVPPDTGDDGPKPTVPSDVYHEQLVSVRDALQLHIDNPQEGDQLLSRLQAAQVRVRGLIDSQEPSWRPVFEALLAPPIESAAVSSNRAFAESSGRRWCNEVVLPFERNVRGMYPFSSRGQDVPLDSFASFYRPGDGALWKFTREALGNVVQVNGDSFSFVRRFGKEGSSAYSSALLEFLARSRDVTSVFYPQGKSEPRVDLKVRIHGVPTVATTTFSIGGKSIQYHNGPEQWYALSWPGPDPQAGASFVASGANGMREQATRDGPWGLFRLLEAGTVTRASSRMFSVAWQLRTHDVTLRFDFEPVRGESPFFGVPGRAAEPKLMQPLRESGVAVPKQIAHSGEPCRI